MKIFQGMLAAGLLASMLYPYQTQAQVLAAPSNLAASSVSSSQIDMTWTDNSSNEQNFQLQFATKAAFTSATRRNMGLTVVRFAFQNIYRCAVATRNQHQIVSRR